MYLILAILGFIVDFLWKDREEGRKILTSIREHVDKTWIEHHDFIEKTVAKEYEPLLRIYSNLGQDDPEMKKLFEKERKLTNLLDYNRRLQENVKRFRKDYVGDDSTILQKDISKILNWLRRYISPLHTPLFIESKNILIDLENEKQFLTMELNYIQSIINFSLKRFSTADKHIKAAINNLDSSYYEFRNIKMNLYLVEARIYRGMSVYENNKLYLTTALNSYMKAHQLDGNDPNLLSHIAFCLNDSEEHIEALKYHVKASQLSQGSPGKIDALGYGCYYLGKTLKGDKTQYETIKKLLVELNIVDPTHYETGTANTDADALVGILFSKAKMAYDKALCINPKQSVHLEHRGRLFFEQGLYTEALDDFRKSIQSKAYYPFSLAGLGATIYELSKNNNNALSHNRQYLVKLLQEALEAMQASWEFYANIPIRHNNNFSTPLQTKEVVEMLKTYMPEIQKSFEKLNKASPYDELCQKVRTLPNDWFQSSISFFNPRPISRFNTKILVHPGSNTTPIFFEFPNNNRAAPTP